MPDAQHGLHGDFVGAVTVGDDGSGLAQTLDGIEQRERLRAVPMPGQMESEDKTGLTVHNQPEVILDAPDLHDGFIRVPLVGVEIERRDQLKRNVVEQRRELRTPVADGGMRNPDIHNSAQNQGDIPERVLSHIEHRQRRQNDMHRIAHSLEIGFSRQLGHGRRRNDCRLRDENGMAAFLVAALVI